MWATGVVMCLYFIDNELYIGAGKDLDTNTFFSGMIDDIRIYNAALSVEEIDALAQIDTLLQ